VNWHLDPFFSAQVLRRNRVAFQEFIDGPLGGDFAAMLAGARPKLQQVVGGQHRLFVVLDDEHRVA